MRAPRSLRNHARASRQAARMNELDRVVRHALNSGPQFEHRDTESLVERAWQGEPAELHIGFRV